MKAPLKINALVWLSNIILAALVLATLFTLFLAIWGSILVPNADDMEGVTRYSSQFGFLGDTYLYEYERVDDQVVEGYHLLSPDRLYRFSVSDSVMFRTQKLNEELSSVDSQYLGAFRVELKVYGAEESVPLMIGHPGISLDRAQFLQRIQREALSRALLLVFIFSVVWQIRRFVKGLQQMKFFTRSNAWNLKVTALLILAAPFLELLWRHFTAMDVSEPYRATLYQAGAPEFMFGTLFFGLVLWAIAWCFDYGVYLQQEQQLTI